MCAERSNTSVSGKSDSLRRVTTNLGVSESVAETVEDENASVSTVSSNTGMVRTSIKRILSPIRFLYEEDENGAQELPADFRILPIYTDILEEPLPPMEVFPVFRVEDGQIDEVVKQMDFRLRRNHTYKGFLEETRNLLTYTLQEVKNRKILQNQLSQRDVEMQNFIERYKRDPRIYKMMVLADHWRTQKDSSEERTQSLLMEINALTMDMKMLENKLVSMQKRHDKMELQIQKSKTCDQEKERLEEQIMVREKALVDITETVENLKTTVTMIQADAMHKETDFRDKLLSAPDRNAMKLAVMTRELEVMSWEKEHKVQEAREMHDHVNSLIVENARTGDKVKVLMGSIRGLRAQLRALESQHQAVVSKNKGLVRMLSSTSANVKLRELDTLQQSKENHVLKLKLEALQKLMKIEEGRHTASLRKISQLEAENKRLGGELADRKFTIKVLEQASVDANKSAQKYEAQSLTATRNHQTESQRSRDLYQKLVVSGKHIRLALHNIGKMNEVIDRTGERLRVLDLDLLRCQQENVRNQATITHLNRILENKENMVRLRTHENDALVISKKNLMESLRTCYNFRKRLTYDVSRLHSIKTRMEDSAFTHRFMLEFVESERDGAIRTAEHCEESIVLLQRDQLAKLHDMARVNSDSSRLKLRLEEIQHQLNMQKREVINLNRMLKTSENACKNVEALCKAIMQQRDFFGHKLLQQNTEAELARMKMDNLKRLIDVGNTSYRDRCNDIIVLKKEIQNLRRRLKALEHTECLCHELKIQVTTLSKNLYLEMNRRAEIEKAKMPRIHRFKELQNSDPSMYEMILKIQRLQKTVIIKTQESIAREKELAIRNDTVKQLTLIARRRDLEKNKKHWIRSIVVAKNHKIKALMAEVNMLNYNLEINSKVNEEQRQELSTVKKQLVTLRRAKSAKDSSAKSEQVSQGLGKKRLSQSAYSFIPGKCSGSETSFMH